MSIDNVINVTRGKQKPSSTSTPIPGRRKTALSREREINSNENNSNNMGAYADIEYCESSSIGRDLIDGESSFVDGTRMESRIDGLIERYKRTKGQNQRLKREYEENKQQLLKIHHDMDSLRQSVQSLQQVMVQPSQ